MTTDATNWPEVIVINGIEYRHRCDDLPYNSRRRTYICPCGKKWYRIKGSLGMWTTDEKRAKDGKGLDL